MKIILTNTGRHAQHVHFRRVAGTPANEIAEIPVTGTAVIYPADESEQIQIVKDLEIAHGIEATASIDLNGLCPFVYSFEDDADQDLVVEIAVENMKAEADRANGELEQIKTVEVPTQDGAMLMNLEVVSDQKRGNANHKQGRR